MSVRYPPSFSSLSAGLANLPAAARVIGSDVSSRSQSTAMRSRCAMIPGRLRWPSAVATITKVATRASVIQPVSIGASAGPCGVSNSRTRHSSSASNAGSPDSDRADRLLRPYENRNRTAGGESRAKIHVTAALSRGTRALFRSAATALLLTGAHP